MKMDVEQWIADWFVAWTDGWIEAGNELISRNLRMKQEHTKRVVDLVSELAQAEGLDDETAMLCRISAWLHDVGRFPQFSQFETFADNCSVPHAPLSVDESELGPLSWLCPDRAAVVRTAVTYHSAFAIPETVVGRARTVSQLLRDADKLDIWQIVLEHYENGEPSDGPALGPELETEGWNPEFVDALLASRCAITANKRSVIDLKLLQIGWIFDISSIHACALAKKECYIERLMAFLPDTEAMDRVRKHLCDWFDQRLAGYDG
jgi:hypothetical protein